MRILAYGDIMDGGQTVFTSVTGIDGGVLKITFSGAIRVDSPYRHLESYVKELREIVAGVSAENVEFDFTELSFCNSNGFYVIMDITELVLGQIHGAVVVQRLAEDDWHQETLPILLNADEPAVNRRLEFVEHEI